MTFQEWQTYSLETHQRAERIRAMIMDRARTAAERAGTGMGCALHNALLARSEGRPWAEVDYQQARLANHLVKQSWKPSRIADKASSKAWNRMAREHGYAVLTEVQA